MKKHYLFLLLLAFAVLSSFVADAQKKCKFSYEKKDPFTGKLQRFTSTPIVPATIVTIEYWYLGLVKDGDDYNVQILVNLIGDYKTYIEKGDSIMFKFANGDMITCYAKEQGSPKVKIDVNSTSAPVQTSFQCNYSTLSADNMKTFSTSLLTYIKMNIGSKVLQREVKEKHAKDLLKDAGCITQ